MKHLAIALCTLLLVVVLTACGEGSDTPAEKESASKKGDAQATFACRNYRKMASDVNDRLLNDAELRAALKKIHGDARLSETDGVATGAEKMLAAITANDTDGFTAAGNEFNRACEVAGV